jgi:hypothetical protein
MTKKEFYLLKIAEESAELAQAALKLVYFDEGGVNPKDPQHVNNLHSLVLEYSQQLAAVEAYLRIARDTPTWKVLPYDSERLIRMTETATQRQSDMYKLLKFNGVIE